MKTKTQYRKSQKGFSLIELLLVLAILAILSTIVMMNFTGQTQKAKITAAKAQITALENAISTFEIQNDNPPTEEQGLDSLYNRPSDELENWTRLLKKPVDSDPWGSPYIYRQPGTDENPYDLYSVGPDKVDGTEDDIPEPIQ